MFCQFRKGARIAWLDDPAKVTDTDAFARMFNEKLPEMKEKFGSGPFTVQEVNDSQRRVQILPRADAWLDEWWFVSV